MEGWHWMDLDEVRNDLRGRLRLIKPAGGQSGPEGMSEELDQSPEEKTVDRVEDGLYLFDRGMAGGWVGNAQRSDGGGAKPRRGREVFQDRVVHPDTWADYHILKWSVGRISAYTILRRDDWYGQGVLDLGQSDRVLVCQLEMVAAEQAWRAKKDAKAMRDWGLTFDQVEYLRYLTNPRVLVIKNEMQAGMMRKLAKQKGWL